MKSIKKLCNENAQDKPRINEKGGEQIYVAIQANKLIETSFVPKILSFTLNQLEIRPSVTLD